MGRKSGNPNENDQKKSVLSNVDVIQKIQKSKGAIKKNTHMEKNGVSATDKTSTTKWS
jgi:hypothetical protein